VTGCVPKTQCDWCGLQECDFRQWPVLSLCNGDEPAHCLKPIRLQILNESGSGSVTIGFKSGTAGL